MKKNNQIRKIKEITSLIEKNSDEVYTAKLADFINELIKEYTDAYSEEALINSTIKYLKEQPKVLTKKEI